MSEHSSNKSPQPRWDTLIKPPALTLGDTIGIFTPSSPVNVSWREKYLFGIEQLRKLGFNVVEGSLTASLASQGYRAGDGRARAREVMELFADPTVDALMSTIGGKNSASLTPYLDYELIRNHPKIVCGYSDVTSLHLALNIKAGLSTFYGPAVAPSFGEWPEPARETVDSFLQAVMLHRSGSRELPCPKRWSNHLRNPRTDEWRTVSRAYQPHGGWRVLRQGAATGALVAANLNTLCSNAGTDVFPDLRGKILLLEEMSAPWSTAERNFRQMERIGVFDEIAGLLVGRPEMPDPEGAPFSFEELVMEIIDGRGSFPIVAYFDCCHTTPMLTLAQGVQLSIDAREDLARVRVEEAMVS